VRGGTERVVAVDLRAPLFCGVDVGSSALKLVLLGGDGGVRSRTILPTGVDYSATARAALESALLEAGESRDREICCVATGHGRDAVPFSHRSQTEIHCHGQGCHHTFRRRITILDIGGQDTKVITLDDEGRTLGFALNRACATGTGAFLEEVALRLALSPSELEPLAQRAEESVALSSFCTVFAKSEILTHLKRGVPVERIVRGAFASVVERALELHPLEGEVVLTGGVVAHNPTVADLLARRLGRRVQVAPHPQHTGALGAALLARAGGGGEMRP